MKLCTFEFEGMQRVGIVLDDKHVADVTLAYATYLDKQGETKAYQLANVLTPPTMLGIVEGGESSLNALRETLYALNSAPDIKGPKGEKIKYLLDEVKLCAPIPRPPKILGPNWNQKGGQESLTRPPIEPHPFYAIKLPTSVTGPFDPIEMPDVGKVISEVEAAIVIGKKGKNIPVEKANEYIFGCTIINDLTALDLRDNSEWVIVKSSNGEQAKFTTAARYKCFDTFCPMGPWIVTRDEIDIHNCRMESRFDGELDKTGTTADMFFNFYKLIAYFSEAHTLEPGDLISSGTVPLAPARKATNPDSIDVNIDGGILESTIQGIGTIRNQIRCK